MQGHIKLYRQLLENPVICKDSDHFSVWGYILLNATYKEVRMYFGGKQITLKPGQLITGRKKIAEKFNISESKVQRILKTFEIEQQIEQQTNNQHRLITVKNWSEYQTVEQQTEQPVNNQRTASEQPVNTNKKDKKEKKDKKVNIEIADKPQISLGEFQKVSMTQEQYNTLCEKYGQTTVDDKIAYLDAQIQSKVKKYMAYKDHYATIGNWCRADQKKERASPRQERPTENYDHLAIDPFEGS